MNEKKKRYIIGDQYSPQLSPSAAQRVDSFVAQSEDVREVRRTSTGRRIVEMTEEQMLSLARRSLDVVIEEDTPLELLGMPGIPALRAPSDKTYELMVDVRDEADSSPIPNVTIFGLGRSGLAYQAVTNDQGRAVLRSSENPLTRLIASPRDTHWSRFIADVDLTGGKSLDIKLQRLLAAGAYDWGHRLMGFRAQPKQFSGVGIKVAVIDSGVANRVEDVRLEGGCNASMEIDDGTQDWNEDENGHGTHISGIIASRNSALGFTGGAPQAKMYSVKVMPGGLVSDLIVGIEWCIRNRVDVMNVGLGGYGHSQLLAAAIRDAYDRGITCVAAAGNNGCSLAYPAALPTTISVGAIGRFGSFPEESAHALKVSKVFDTYGGLFAANFSNHGQQLDVCAPGVAILSTVPTGYASWDGTSMASSMVTALVALILQAYPTIRTRDAQQVEFVRQILSGAAVNLNMPRSIQGSGLPLATNALPQA